MVVVCLLLCSCSKSFKSELVGALDDATEKMKEAKDVDEGKDVNKGLCAKMDEIAKNFTSEDILKLDEDDQKEISDAYDRYMEARKDKCGDAHMFMELPSLDKLMSKKGGSDKDNSSLDNDSDNSSSSGSEDWDEILDSYNSVVSNYVTYAESAAQGDMSAVTECTELMDKAKELGEKLNNVQDEMSESQKERYLEITNKLSEAASNMQ